MLLEASTSKAPVCRIINILHNYFLSQRLCSKSFCSNWKLFEARQKPRKAFWSPIAKQGSDIACPSRAQSRDAQFQIYRPCRLLEAPTIAGHQRLFHFELFRLLKDKQHPGQKTSCAVARHAYACQ